MSDVNNAPVAVSEDLPTSTEVTQTDKHSADPEQKKAYAFDKQFGELNRKIKKGDAKLEESGKALESANSEVSQLKAKLAEFTVPKEPDANLEFDNPDEFNRQKEAVRTHQLTQIKEDAVLEAEARINKRLNTERDQEQLRKKEETFNQQASDHIKKGQAIGLSEEDLITSASVLAQAGVPNEVQSFLFNDPEGPQIMDFLANNPKELEAMIGLDAISQASYIERSVRANAVSTKPTVTGAPDPLLNISGGGMQELDDFDKLCPGAEFK